MYILYVDESGDPGIQNSPTTHFALSGLVVHELRWSSLLDELIDFRRYLRQRYGLKLREEIHAGSFISRPGRQQHIVKSLRLRILREVLDFQASRTDINVLSVVVDKRTKSPDVDIFDYAWKALFQRFHNTIVNRNFPPRRNDDDYGLAFVDVTSEKKLRLLLRKARRYNPVPHMGGGGGYRQIPLHRIIEDPTHRNSADSLFIQLADVNAFFLYQFRCKTSQYILKQGARNYYRRLDPVLCKVATIGNPHGIVML